MSDSSARLSSALPLRIAEANYDCLTLSPLRVGKQQTSPSVAAWSSWKIVTRRSGWLVGLFDGKQTNTFSSALYFHHPNSCVWAELPGHCGTARAVTTILTQNVQCHGHNMPWRLSESQLIPTTCPTFLKSSVPFTALRAKGLQHRRNEPRENTNSPSSLHHLPLLKKRQEQETTMCLQSQSSLLVRHFSDGFGGLQAKTGMAFQSIHPFPETPPSLLPESCKLRMD